VRFGWPTVPFRLRVFFRGAFLLLALAVVALALSVLQEEKHDRYRGYRDVFAKNAGQIAARLQHPTGQLALMNAASAGGARTAVRPLVLPFSSIDFDDKTKARQAVEVAGCLVRYPNHAELCVAVGNNPLAGGFIYAVGAFASGPLVEHHMGDLDLSTAHRLRVTVALRGRTYRWVAPLEGTTETRGHGLRGRLTGFAEDEQGGLASRPNKEFRGWLWQDARCLDDTPVTAASPDCAKRSFFAVRLPVDVFREDIYDNPHVIWPPRDLANVRVQVQAYAPANPAPLFDSSRDEAAASFALSDLHAQLLPGEALRIRRLTGDAGAEIVRLTGPDAAPDPAPRLLRRLIRRLPHDVQDEQPLRATQVIATPVGDYEVVLSGDVHSVDRSLEVTVQRLSWFVAAMLAAIMLTWLAIEVRIIRRITVLTQRAASVKKSVRATEGLLEVNLQDLRGRDELGLLAGVLADLLQRVNEDVKREQIRTDREKDMWHAVGHEILAPLQSLMALHARSDDPSRRYIERMQQAVRVLYGAASPSEAIESAFLQVQTLDINGFLSNVAANAVHAGIGGVTFADLGSAVIVRADEHSLEDVITHVLGNADRYRTPGTAIRVILTEAGQSAEVRVYNEGPSIPEDRLEKIFEYGVSDAADTASGGHRGQGLFVARTYMAKMGGTVIARNLPGGVEFIMTLARA